MAASQAYLAYVLEQLAGLDGIASRRMFGGFGLYCDGIFFALISGDVLYFKVGSANRQDYAERGMRQFRPFADRPQVSAGYHELPADILEDSEQCVAWARRSVAAAAAPAAQAVRTTQARRGAKRRLKRGRP
jgi:DNA transformation protein